MVPLPEDQKIATENCSKSLVRHGCNSKSRIHIAWLLDVMSEQAKKVLIHIPEDICERILAFFKQERFSVSYDLGNLSSV